MRNKKEITKRVHHIRWLLLDFLESFTSSIDLEKEIDYFIDQLKEIKKLLRK